jgi:hypothetical protein
MITSATEEVPMLQKDDAEHPVPEPLRSTFRQIAGAFVAGDFQLRHQGTVEPTNPPADPV